MLVKYTPISELNSTELTDLKRIITQITLEGREHFPFRGKILSAQELRQAKQIWESEALKATGRQQLME